MDELLRVHQRRVVYDPAYCSLLLDLGEPAMPAIIWEPYTSLDVATEPSEKRNRRKNLLIPSLTAEITLE